MAEEKAQFLPQRVGCRKKALVHEKKKEMTVLPDWTFLILKEATL